MELPSQKKEKLEKSTEKKALIIFVSSSSSKLLHSFLKFNSNLIMGKESKFREGKRLFPLARPDPKNDREKSGKSSFLVMN
jgi:hypothetical protein